MPHNVKCRAPGCAAEGKPWRSSSVGDWLKDNPGWQWILDYASESFVLCPEHSREAAELTAQLMRLTGDYCVNPILRKLAQELGLAPSKEK